jgi:phosphoribosylaminoimidazolecarboxamide formyltransferase/IMP cyclohydrolase
MRAIISVANRDGLVELVRELQSHQVQAFATEKTRQFLSSEGIAVSPFDELGQIPTILDEQLSTLHPVLFGGILARRGFPPHEKELLAHHIPLIDIVIVNLYPFSELVRNVDAANDEVLEQIDISGVALLRAAAKNFQDVVVLTRPEDYVPVMQEWREQGEVSTGTRRRLATIAFQETASYDAAVAGYLRGESGEQFPEELTLALERIYTLRYGENPHQQAAFYRQASTPTQTLDIPLPTIANAEVLQGNVLSYNNLLDLDSAMTAVQSFTAPTVAIVKHTNPCGLACADNVLEAYKHAHSGDPISAFGGVIGSNRPIDEATAHQISQLFYEAIIAPDFTPEAQHVLKQRKSLRLLATHCPIEPRSMNARLLATSCPEIRSVGGGLLLQTPDVIGDAEADYRVVTDRDPTLEELTDLMFAWKVVRCVKSNAIVLAHKLMVVGVGAGQMSRVTSVQLAVDKAAQRARGSVLASDAFFPFADGVEAAARAGVTAIVQPGGSLRDEEAIRMANRHAIAMIFTGQRHFRH